MSSQTETVFQPKVSIVIPVYNGANFMREAIDSALAQTYANVEVIVVNDGSTDGGATAEIAHSYGDRIRYFEKENGGVSSALNLGIRHMSGEYFSWLSHDDSYLPDKVRLSVERLGALSDRDRVIALCGSSHMNERSEVIHEAADHLETGRLYSGDEVLLHLLNRSMLNMCCMLIPKTAFDECEPFHEDLRYNQDTLMLYRIFSKGYRMIAYTDDRMVRYRLHAQQTSKTRRDLFMRDSLELVKIIGPVFVAKEGVGKSLLRSLADNYAKHDCTPAVAECLRIGREKAVFGAGDRCHIRLRMIGGKLRGILKAIYYRIKY